MAEAGQGIIRRKVAAARTVAAEGGPGADRSWRLALARAARDILKTTLDFRTMTLDRRSLAEIMELPPDRSLIAVLDGPREALGVIFLSPAIMAGFIEAQTIGKVKATDLVHRKPTRTDAAMVASVIDAALRGLEAGLADEADLVWAGGFRYASFLNDPRPLGLLLEDTVYKVLRAEVDLAGGARHGEIVLAMPAEGRGTMPVSKAAAGAVPDHGHLFVQALSERVNGANCRLEAVLARLTLPLSEVMGLTEGALLALPQAGLERISLEGFDGRLVAEARLGQNRGMRAVRLNEAVGSDGASHSQGHGAGMEMEPDGSMVEGGFGGAGEMTFDATGTD